MNDDRHIWREWARILHRWGVIDWTASFLDAAGPLTIFGAQFLYIGQPLLSSAVPSAHLDALSRMLEDSNCTKDFVTFLREEGVSWI
jgi:hypothetical protein